MKKYLSILILIFVCFTLYGCDLKEEKFSIITFDFNCYEKEQYLCKTTNNKIDCTKPIPSCSNYTFSGWYDKDGNKVDVDSDFVEDTTLYAGWDTIEEEKPEDNIETKPIDNKEEKPIEQKPIDNDKPITDNNTEQKEDKPTTTETENNNNTETTTTPIDTTVYATSVSLNYTSYNLMIGESVTLKATISPSNTTNKNVTWSSSNTSVASVSNGTVKGVSSGTSIITATTSNGKKVTCTITVKDVNKIHYVSNGVKFVAPKDGSKGPSPANTIVLESNGHFALIDTGLANSNSLNSGHATLVLNYLKKLGAKKLDFILITHDHYDHAGGLSELLDGIQTDIVYIKPYYSRDEDGAGNQTTRTIYASILKKYFGSSFSCDSTCLKSAASYREALKTVDSLYGKSRTNVGKLKMTSTLYKINANAEGKVLTLGTMKLTMYNTTNIPYHSECYGTSAKKFNENSNSIVSYIKMNKKTALITGDLGAITKKCYNAIYGSCESSTCSIMNYIMKKMNNGKKLNVDLMDLPHHGYSSCDMSTTIRDFINPSNVVIPNWKEKVTYYYSNGGPYNGKRSCQYLYFSNTSYNFYNVGTNNTVFEFTDNTFKKYTN